MRKITILLFTLISFLSGCKTADSPVTATEPSTTGIILGNVSSFISGNSISQVIITTTPATNSITTDIYGDFYLDNIKPGAYTITAFKSNYDSTSTKVVVTAGVTTRADMTLKVSKITSPGRLRGIIINAANDSLISDANIYTSTKPYYSTKTNALGNYDIYGISPGDYDLTVEKFGFTAKTVKITVISDSIQTVNFSLQPLYGLVKGKVTDAISNLPITGVNISSTPATSSVSTDTYGNYLLENLPKGAYKITAIKEGYVTSSISITVIEGKLAVGDIIMTKK